MKGSECLFDNERLSLKRFISINGAVTFVYQLVVFKLSPLACCTTTPARSRFNTMTFFLLMRFLYNRILTRLAVLIKFFYLNNLH